MQCKDCKMAQEYLSLKNNPGCDRAVVQLHKHSWNLITKRLHYNIYYTFNTITMHYFLAVYYLSSAAGHVKMVGLEPRPSGILVMAHEERMEHQ